MEVEPTSTRPNLPTFNRWLLGTDPVQYSFADFEHEDSTRWDGVTDYVALKFLHDIVTDDQALVCEIGEESQIVGVVRAISDAYPDPTQDDPDFRDLDLEELGELSVVPLTPRLWDRILEMGGGLMDEDEEDEEAGEATAREAALVGEESR